MKDLLFQDIRGKFSRFEEVSPRKAAFAAYQLLRLPHSRRRVGDQFAERVFATAENFSINSDSNQIQVYRWTLPTRGPRPTRPVVFLIHDWNSSSRSMAGLVTPLVLAGFDTVAIDLPGHGFSSGLFADLPACLRALRDVAEVLGSPMTVVGHGLGGSIAAMACVRSSNFAMLTRVKRLVLIGAPDRMTDVVNRFAEEFLNKEETILLLHELVDSFLHGPSACFATASAVWSSACTTLVIHDKNDPLVPHDDAVAIASHMKEGKFISTEHLGHRRILRTKSVSREVARFVEQEIVRPGVSSRRPQASQLPELKSLLGGEKM